VRGHIQERGKGRWRIKVYVGRDATGRKRYAQRTVAGKHSDAERELSRLLVEVDEGRVVASPAMTLDELLDRWLDVKRQAVEPSTWCSYEWVARRYVRPALGTHSSNAETPARASCLRTAAIRTCSTCRPRSDGSSGHNSSTSRSAATTRPRFIASSASRARSFGARGVTSMPSTPVTSNGPSKQISTAAPHRIVERPSSDETGNR